MPDAYGNLTEAELRGQAYVPSLFGYAPPSRADLQARDAAARAGNGTVSMSNGQTLTGSEFRSSTDPAVMQLYQQMLQGGRSDPNLLFGGTSGRTQSDAERRYRDQYSSFMNNPNDGVSGSEAARAVGLWALAPIAGYALGPGGAAGAAGGAGSAASTGASITAGEAVIGGAGTAGTAALNASVPSIAPLVGGSAGFAGYGAMGGMQPNSGLGVFANGGTQGMAGVGGGNMGALAAEQAAAGGGMASLANNFNTVRDLVGAASGSQGSGGMQIPMGMLGSSPSPPPQQTGSYTRPGGQLNQSFTRMRSYGRTPINFRGATIWL